MKKKTNICSEKFCRKKCRRSNSKCSSCIKKAYAKRHPTTYAYSVLKNNAKRRGKEFSLTLEDFTKFCYKTNYLAGRGRSVNSLTIDRIDNSKGYSIDNIQPLTRSQNSIKGVKVLVYDWQERQAFVRTIVNSRTEEDNLF